MVKLNIEFDYAVNKVKGGDMTRILCHITINGRIYQ